jgi:hypothetical protein
LASALAAAVSAVEAAGAVTVAAAVPEVMQAKNRSTLIGLRATAQAILADIALARAAQAARRAAPPLATRASAGEHHRDLLLRCSGYPVFCLRQAAATKKQENRPPKKTKENSRIFCFSSAIGAREGMQRNRGVQIDAGE